MAPSVTPTARMPVWVLPLALLLVPLILYGGYSVTGRAYQSYKLAQEEADLRREVEDLRRENVRLQRDLIYARSDQAIEAIARQQLNLIRPGDKSVLVVGTGIATPEPVPDARGANRPSRQGKWSATLDWLFGR